MNGVSMKLRGYNLAFQACAPQKALDVVYEPVNRVVKMTEQEIKIKIATLSDKKLELTDFLAYHPYDIETKKLIDVIEKKISELNDDLVILSRNRSKNNNNMTKPIKPDFHKNLVKPSF